MKILLVGDGQMGQLVEQELNLQHEVTMVGLINSDNIAQLKKEAFNSIIDFSHPDNLTGICELVKEHPIPVVIATTGYSEEQIAQIKDLSNRMPVLYSANYSMGVILMNRVAKEISSVLSDNFDIEVIEKHHHRKVDAPSGTAKMLVNSINENLQYDVVHGREGEATRSKKEIGVHTIRGGSIVGEHEVLFAGADEILSIKHEALSKSIFAKGAIQGVNWLVGKENGLYDMEDILFKSDKLKSS